MNTEQLTLCLSVLHGRASELQTAAQQLQIDVLVLLEEVKKANKRKAKR